MVRIRQGLVLALLTLTLVACGGGDQSLTKQTTTTTGDTSGTGSTTNGGTVADPDSVLMGSGTGSGFTANVLAVAVTSLAAGGSTSVTAVLADASGNPYVPSVDVAFTSTCAASGRATLTPATVPTVAGQATATYSAQGCQGTDTIIATADIDGTGVSASGTVTVASADLGSIQFVSAEPTLMFLKGTGGANGSETSRVTFRVVDKSGGPVADKTVTFSLNTTVGGLSLTPSSAVSDDSGLVQTVVQAGTVPTPVRVTATVSGTTPEIGTQSDQLAVTTGIPDQDSLSVSATTLNPEAWDADGVEVTVTARAADRYNNPVPDGTTVTFTAEGGSIDGSCTTVNGACSVTWRSQSPRPCGETLGNPTLQDDVALNQCLADTGSNPTEPQEGTAPLGQPYGGRVTILATMVGEESFDDRNGNGVFDDGDTFTDLPEAWRDDDEDGTRDAQEIFVDFDEDGGYDAADGLYNGVLCQHSSLCSSKTTLTVRDSLTLVMSGTTANAFIRPASYTDNNGNGIFDSGDVVDPATYRDGDGDGRYDEGESILMPNDGSVSITVVVSDLHNQPMPAGTTFAFSTTQGSVAQGFGTYTVANRAGNNADVVTVPLEGAGPDSEEGGIFSVTVTTPGGSAQTFGVSVVELGPPSVDMAVTSVSASPSGSVTNDGTGTGDLVTYTFTVANQSSDTAATGVVLTVTPPDSTVATYNSSSGCFGTTSLTCAIGTLAAGASTTVTVTFNPIAAGTMAVTGSIAATEDDNNSGNNSGGMNTLVN
ncbi:MAG TPA: DUF11 domain-containing protein [Gammaproteobacteria bacterium]|nr:DUF11 domain-containing protein [Gammaproteobacteria bacterium]